MTEYDPSRSCNSSHIRFVSPFAVGEVLSGKKVVKLTCFCTAECKDYQGTDELDHMKDDNHTLEYSDRYILRDFLHALNHGSTEEECQQFSRAYIAKMDGFIESGMVGKGNKFPAYREQCDTRFAQFCEAFKDLLAITDGPSVIEGKTYRDFQGIHIIGAAGALSLGLRALISWDKDGKPLDVLVESIKIRDFFFQRKANAHRFDVIENAEDLIRVFPFVHPNRHQQFLTTYSEEEITKLDYSYSHAHRALDGAEISVQGTIDTFRATLSTANLQRYKLRKEAQKLGIDPDDAADLRELTDLDKIVKRAKLFKEMHNKRRKNS